MHARLLVLALLLTLAGCDAIYDRPEPVFPTDFGAPYGLIVTTAGVQHRLPMLSADGTLAVEVEFRGGCASHTFQLRHRLRGEDYAEIWLRHVAPDEACAQPETLRRTLFYVLPNPAQEAETVVLLRPNDREIVLRGGR